MQVEIYHPSILWSILVDPPSNVAFPPKKNLAEPGIHFLLTKSENRGAWHWDSRRLSVIHDLPMEGANCEGPGKPTNQHGRTEPTERYKNSRHHLQTHWARLLIVFLFNKHLVFHPSVPHIFKNSMCIYIYILFFFLFQLVPVCFGVSSEVSSPLLTPLWTCRKLCSLQIRKRPGIFPAIFLWMDS